MLTRVLLDAPVARAAADVHSDSQKSVETLAAQRATWRMTTSTARQMEQDLM